MCILYIHKGFHNLSFSRIHFCPKSFQEFFFILFLNVCSIYYYALFFYFMYFSLYFITKLAKGPGDARGKKIQEKTFEKKNNFVEK